LRGGSLIGSQHFNVPRPKLEGLLDFLFVPVPLVTVPLPLLVAADELIE
jgi:hypothetical protein